MAKEVTVVGLISDTHGLLREEALRALEGSDLIIHAGDVGKPEIIDTLKALAPVVVVRGNIAKGAWGSSLPMTAVAEAGSIWIYVLHDIGQLEIDPSVAGMRVLVSGHSHKPNREERSGVLYLNPGSAGPRRLRLPVTVARLDLRQSLLKVDFIDLCNGAEQ